MKTDTITEDDNEEESIQLNGEPLYVGDDVIMARDTRSENVAIVDKIENGFAHLRIKGTETTKVYHENKIDDQNIERSPYNDEIDVWDKSAFRKGVRHIMVEGTPKSQVSIDNSGETPELKFEVPKDACLRIDDVKEDGTKTYALELETTETEGM